MNSRAKQYVRQRMAAIEEAKIDQQLSPEAQATLRVADTAVKQDRTLKEKKADAGRLGAEALARTKRAEQSRREIGRKFDEQITQELTAIRDHEKILAGSDEAYFLFLGSEVLRGITWKLEPPPFKFMTNEEWTKDQFDGVTETPMEQRKFMSVAPDAACEEMAQMAKQKFVLSDDLRPFTIRVFESFLDWMAKNPTPGLTGIDQVTKTLAQLKNGDDIFTGPPKKRGKPGPKPKLPEYPSEETIRQNMPEVALDIRDLKPVPEVRVSTSTPGQPESLEAVHRKFQSELDSQNLLGLPTDALRYLRGE